MSTLIHINYLNIIYRGCQYYPLTEPTLSRRAQQQESSPLGLEEMRCTGEGQQQNIAFYNQCITNFNDKQRNAFNIIAACLADNYEGTKVFNINARMWENIPLKRNISLCKRDGEKMYCYSFIRYCSNTLKWWSHSTQYIRNSHSNLKHINLFHKSEQ